MRLYARFFFLICVFTFATALAHAQDSGKAKPRARDLGIPFDGTTGAINAITDVSGVTVGHTTLISGEGKLQVGKGPVRTGVTAVLPRPRLDSHRLIEEFMVLANVAAAEELERRHQPAMYRVHAPPSVEPLSLWAAPLSPLSVPPSVELPLSPASGVMASAASG